MKTKIIENILQLLSKADYKRKLFFLFVFFVLVGPLFIVTYINYAELNNVLTGFVYADRESIAILAEDIFTEKFDRLIDVGTSLATRVQFRKLVNEGKWNDAIAILNTIPGDFPYFYQFALFDTKGTLMAIYPFSEGAIGQNFAYREYYQGVSKNWEPYISNVFKVAIQPSYNVITVAVPIKGDDKKPIGFIALGVKLSTLGEWIKEINAGEDVFIYFVDRNGHLATDHPDFPINNDTGEIIDFSKLPAVQEALSGKRGIDFFINPLENNEEELIAYQPMEEYGWAALVDQSTAQAFLGRNRILNKMIFIGMVFVIIDVVFIYLLLLIVKIINTYRQRDNILLGSMGDGMVAIDRNWNIIEWNNAATTITGFKREEVLGKPFRDYVHFIREHDRAENITFIEETLLYGKITSIENHTILIKKDKSEIFVGDSAAPIFDENKKVDGVIIIFRDMTQEIKSQALKTDFKYASHQMRTPVSKILWNLETISDAKSAKAKNHLITEALESAKSIAKMADRLLSIAEIDQKTVIVNYGIVSVSEVLASVFEKMEGSAKRKEIKISYPAALPLNLETDANLLKEVLFELLDNAIKFSNPGGEVAVQAQAQPDGILIEIKDNGIGIIEEQRPLIFTKFFRGTNYDTTRIPGAGLGLFVCYAYIKMMKGKIWLKSEPANGTSFFVLLPKAR